MKLHEIIVTGVIILGLAIGSIAAYRDDPQNLSTLAIWVVVVAMAIVYVAWTSIYKIETDQYVASFGWFGGTLTAVYVSGTLADQDPRALASGGQRGLFDCFNFVILLWPFWIGVKIPTTSVTLEIPVGRAYTEERNDTDETLTLRVDTTLQLRLSPDFGPVATTFNVLGKKGTNLAELVEVSGIQDRAVYKTPRIGQILADEVRTNILQAVRDGVSECTWKEMQTTAGKAQLQRLVLRSLSENPNSPFVTGGLLQWVPPNQNRPPGPSNLGHAELGPSVLSLVFVIEDVKIEDDEVAKALNAPMLGKFEGQRTANRIQEICARPGITPEQALSLLALENIKSFQVVAGDTTVMDMVRSWLGKRATP